MTKEKYLQTQSKEQIIIFYMNEQYINNILREKLFMLTGCPEFGNFDPMNGSCVYCDEENPDQCYRCRLFGDAFKNWRHHCEEKTDVSRKSMSFFPEEYSF